MTWQTWPRLTAGRAQRIVDVVRVAPLIRRWQRSRARSRSPYANTLHIWLDDGNASRDDVAFCVTEAARRKDRLGALIATLAFGMSSTQRCKLAHARTVGGVRPR